MVVRLQEAEQRHGALERLMAEPQVASNRGEYQRYAKEYAELGRVVERYRRYKSLLRGIEGSTPLLKETDEELRRMAQEEIDALTAQQEQIEHELVLALLPKDPHDDKNVVLEIRAGTGGEEAALFAANLFRMYAKYAEENRWHVEILSQHPTGVGGFKEIIALIEGEGAYRTLKYESGVHRVQRVPVTESQGRIHTSAVTVAVLPEAEEVDVQIDPKDLKIDVYRSSGPGGQHVNTTDSAVRVTHLPTGIVTTCQDEKSQHKNKAKALKVLRARLLDIEQQRQQEELAKKRRSQVGTGDRSERIRTYNFPQGRVTDHRIGLTLYRLEAVLEGNLQDIIDPLITHYQTEALQRGASQ
ncbi:MAG: peptide chain release factor 1 [Deltaproteobacteria bacterium RBG_16_54_18]|nr:MAG: peptide chain release factor 1 [Deltaproteobacteria bacterium RBG_16_54_18]